MYSCFQAFSLLEQNQILQREYYHTWPLLKKKKKKNAPVKHFHVTIEQHV